MSTTIDEVWEGMGDDGVVENGSSSNIPLVVWIRLILLAGVSFWCQAVVTEERLVPALHVIAKYYKIPNDIAGATLVAAGASSPELFSSFVSLFITHSALGLGTIVGSEIFNQLIICSGAVFSSQTGTLVLDKAIVIREVGFYSLSILLLYLALRDVRHVDADDEYDHIFISFSDSLLIFSGYILYVIVCAKMESIVNLVTRIKVSLLLARGSSSSSSSTSSLSSSIELQDHHHNIAVAATNEGSSEKDQVPLIDKQDHHHHHHHHHHHQFSTKLKTKNSLDHDRYNNNNNYDEEDTITSYEEQQQHHHQQQQKESTLHVVEALDHHHSLIQLPKNASDFDFVLWLVLLPLRYAMHYTLPDVRKGGGGGEEEEISSPLSHTDTNSHLIWTAYMSTFMCIVWLIVGSYAMVSSLEALAELLDIPDAVIGVTVSAAGTSLPNYVASRIAAEQGLGNMAVSNAFGSNIFNIMIGLGLPWVLYTSFVTKFQPYHDLRNDDILESIIILAIVLLIFVILMAPTGFVMYRWHGVLFIVIYVAYLCMVFAQNWNWDTLLESYYGPPPQQQQHQQ